MRLETSATAKESAMLYCFSDRTVWKLGNLWNLLHFILHLSPPFKRLNMKFDTFAKGRTASFGIKP